MHSFPDEGKLPHYEMAVDADDDTASAVMLGKQGSALWPGPKNRPNFVSGPLDVKRAKLGLSNLLLVSK